MLSVFFVERCKMSNKINNLIESVNFKMYQVASQPLPEALRDAIHDYECLVAKIPFQMKTKQQSVDSDCYSNESLDTYTNEIKSITELVKSNTPAWLQAECSKFGVEYPFQDISLTARLGNVFFDLYQQFAIRPEAPLANALFSKEIMEYADTLNGDEFNVPEKVSSLVKDIVNSDEMWKKVIVSSWVDVGDKRMVVTLSSAGIMRFTKIIAGIVSAFMDEINEN